MVLIYMSTLAFIIGSANILRLEAVSSPYSRKPLRIEENIVFIDY